jgi:hypothetical protein
MGMSSLVISGRGLGRRQKVLFDDFSVPFPPDVGDGGGLTLRELITRIVLAEVEAFRSRQEKRRLTRVLSAEHIDQGLERGKVEAGGAEGAETAKNVNPEQAVGVALQAFEDGLYLVVIDGVEQRDLEAQVFIQPGSRVTFVRLVFLAGA